MMTGTSRLSRAVRPNCTVRGSSVNGMSTRPVSGARMNAATPMTIVSEGFAARAVSTLVDTCHRAESQCRRLGSVVEMREYAALGCRYVCLRSGWGSSAGG